MKDGFTLMGLVLRMPDDDVLTGREVAWAQTQRGEKKEREWTQKWAWIGETKPKEKVVVEVVEPIKEEIKEDDKQA